MSRRIALPLLIALVLGIVVGVGLRMAVPDGETSARLASTLTVPVDLFLRLIKMVIAPLVFSSLVVGIARLGEGSAVARLGAKTLAWFLGASLVSLTLGLSLANLLKPGAGGGLLPSVSPVPVTLSPGGLGVHDFIVHIVPASIAEAMVSNDVLPIVVFSVFVGASLAAMGEAAAPLIAPLEILVRVMLDITNWVMRVAPFAVFAAIAHVVAIQGPSILITFGRFVGSFYVCLVFLWAILLLAGYLVLGSRVFVLARLTRTPTILAFSTASSEAAYAPLLESLDTFGVPRRVASFVLPLGYSFNLDGSMIYMTFATLFVAQIYHIQIGIWQQILMVLTLMVTSKGMAGVPRASLVVVAAVMPRFGIPLSGLTLVVAVDQLLDMGRTATNVIGNAIAAAVVARWECRLEPSLIDGDRKSVG